MTTEIEWIEEAIPFFQNTTIFKNSPLLTYNFCLKRGLGWSVQIHSLIPCCNRWLSSSSFAPYSIVTNTFPQITYSLCHHPSDLLPHFSATQSFLVVGKWKEKGSNSPREREERSKIPPFPFQDFSTCQFQHLWTIWRGKRED